MNTPLRAGAAPIADAGAILGQRARQALARGLDHHRATRLADAVAAYDDALAAEPELVAALVNKGAALRRLGRTAEAMTCYWQAMAQAPQQVELWCNAGNALTDLGRLDEARAVLGEALRRAPASAEIWYGLALLAIREHRWAMAEACLGRCLALAPDNGAARLQWATLLAEQGRPAEALAQYAALGGGASGDPAVSSGFGQVLISLGRLDEAEAPLRRSLELAPEHLDGHLGLARLYLLRGDFAQGWPEYEWRRRQDSARFPKLAAPEWDGADPAGKTILVYAEQGFGDTLQFARYLPLLARRGAKVVVICQVSLLRLLQAVEGVASAQATWRPLPAHDAWTPLLSLPRHLGPLPAEIGPYLTSPRRGARLPAPLGTRLKVGLAWAGSPTHPGDRQRSLPLETLLPLTGVDGTCVFSLQQGPRAADIKRAAHSALLTDLSGFLGDFADTADMIAGLDLVITVDTAVAHLAGALGKPVWVLIPHAADWRWQLGRDDSPWYPSMRLFRQPGPDDWAPVVERLLAELSGLAAGAPPPPDERAEMVVESLFGRYRMTAPRALLSDPGIRFLVARERCGTGYEYATRSFLDAHLQPNDLFIDIGAHWGIMSLQAATRHPGQVSVLAIEPSPLNFTHLRRWLTDNGVLERVDTVAAFAGDRPGRGELRPESTMGHSLVRQEDGAIAVTTVDALLAARRHLDGRRVIVKIDVEGQEPEVIAGMAGLLASGRVAAVIWERGVEYGRGSGPDRLRALRQRFAGLGFTAWRFEAEDQAGPLVPFVEDGRLGNVIELAPGLPPLPAYGEPRPVPPAQPEDRMLEAALKARELFAASLGRQTKPREALALLGEAAARDAGLSEVWNNLGVLLRGEDRHAAAAACYRRALALSPGDAGVMSNLGNCLREQGRLEEAATLLGEAMRRRPADSGVVYNAGIVHRDAGQVQPALACFDRALELAPDNLDCRWDRALALLQFGDYRRGFPAYEARWGLKKARSRRWPLPRWDGTPLAGQSLFLTDEQGLGDVLQFARFIPMAKRLGAGKVVLECQPEMLRLMSMAPGVDAVVPRDQATPACDLTLPLLSLPGLLDVTLNGLPAQVPYLTAPPAARPLPVDGRRRIGLVWAGKTTPRDRSIPLERLLPLLQDPRIAAYSLQMGPRAADLQALGAAPLVTDLSPRLVDMAETAATLTQLDLLVTIDTSVAHLAGALGVPTSLLLLGTSDWRWFDQGSHSPWYPSLTLFRQKVTGRWDEPLAELAAALAAFFASLSAPAE